MDLDETKRIIAAATEGPWEVVGNGYTETISGDGEDWSEVRAPSGLVTTCVFTGHDETDEQTEADHVFIAHARTALPELVTEIERLQEATSHTACGKSEAAERATRIHAENAALEYKRRAEAAEATVERVRQVVKPQWRATRGKMYSEGRNQMIDDIRAALEPR